MASTDSFVFHGVKCHELSSLNSSPIAEGELSLSIKRFYNEEEKTQLPPDMLSAIFENSICEFEFCSEIQHDFNKIKLNKNFVFTIADKSDSKKETLQTTQFNGFIMNLDRVIKIEGTKKQRYFYSGIKIGKCRSDGLRLFDTFVPKIFLFNYMNKKDMQVVQIPSETALQEFIKTLIYMTETAYVAYNDDALYIYEMTHDTLTFAQNKLWNIGFGMKLADLIFKYQA